MTDWKKKSMACSCENKVLHKRIKGLIHSRDEWKHKLMGHKKRTDAMKSGKTLKDRLILDDNPGATKAK
ncbi:MAG: hypothetical protein LBH60_01450 [Prevotellaceae bacterium]|jgi:hypothetical protein|nr:hypothetical protein [Prevotellaceae bacterium]